jgi:hypothetical protein
LVSHVTIFNYLGRENDIIPDFQPLGKHSGGFVQK